MGVTSVFDELQLTATGDENLNCTEDDDKDEELGVKLKFIPGFGFSVDFSDSFAAEMPKLKLLVDLVSDPPPPDDILKSFLAGCGVVVRTVLLTAISIFGTDGIKGNAIFGRFAGAGGSSSSTLLFFELILELAVTLFLILFVCLFAFLSVVFCWSSSVGNLYSWHSRFSTDFDVLAICRARSVQFCIFFICRSCDIEGTCNSLSGGNSFFESLLLLVGFSVTAGRV